MAPHTKVRLVQHYAHETHGAFNVGEGAAFPPTLAADLIQRGIAITAEDERPEPAPVTPATPAPDPEQADKSMDHPPSDKMMRTPPMKKGKRGF